MKALLQGTLALALVLALLAGAVTPAAAQSGNTWQINFWPNPDWQGNPVSTQFVPMLAFNWGEGAPAPGMPVDNFTARATSSAWFPAGTYQFVLQADDEVSLTINGITQVSTFDTGQSGKNIVVNIVLNEGWHNLQVDYREWTVFAYLFVNWAMIGGGTPPPPAQSCSTNPVPSQTSVVTQFGDFTPCIQQGIHQKFCFVPDGSWNSPNYGSIEMEPPITFWQQCTPDSVQTMQLFVGCPTQSAACSKTAAGFFAR